jgi:hypothetical protein
MKYLLLFVFLLMSVSVQAKEIRTNAVIMPNAPKWLKRVRVDRVTSKIQYKLEWSIRRIKVHFYDSQSEFEKIHNFGKTASAVTKKSKKEQSVHLGPLVNDSNFDRIFGHELVHVIFYQKYTGAIPSWLEEGFANFLSKKKPVDYKWLAKQDLPPDVRTMTRPCRNTYGNVKLHYRVSQALVEMLDKKCDLENLLRLSVQRKLDDYIGTYCEIKDLNGTFKQWVMAKAK